MFCDEFKHFLKLLIEWPIPETLNFSNLDFIQSQTFSTVDRMVRIKTLLADKPGGLLTLFVDAKVKDLLAFVAFDKTLWGHSPFRPENLFEKFLAFGDERGGFAVVLFGKFFNFG